MRNPLSAPLRWTARLPFAIIPGQPGETMQVGERLSDACSPPPVPFTTSPATQNAVGRDHRGRLLTNRLTRLLADARLEVERLHQEGPLVGDLLDDLRRRLAGTVPGL